MRHDLICRTRYSWDDVGRALSWRDFAAFVAMSPPDSALYRATHRESWAWDTGAATSHISAHVVDELRILNYMFARAHGADPGMPERMRRPFATDEPRRRFDVEAFRERLRRNDERGE